MPNAQKPQIISLTNDAVALVFGDTPVKPEQIKVTDYSDYNPLSRGREFEGPDSEPNIENTFAQAAQDLRSTTPHMRALVVRYNDGPVQQEETATSAANTINQRLQPKSGMARLLKQLTCAI